MKKSRFNPVWLASVLLILSSLACGFLLGAPTAPASTSIPLPAATESPMAPLSPTETPQLAPAQQAPDVQARIQRYVQNGYLSSDKGNFSALQDLTINLAKINYFSFKSAGYPDNAKDFAAWADIKLSNASAVNYPEYSGCGFTFRFDQNGDSYTAMVTKDRVLLTACRNKSCHEVGKTHGSGKLSYQSNFEANVELIVNDTDARVLVDNQSIGEYTLSSDYLINPGLIAYSMISGSNKDYGTRCEFSQAGLWIPQ